MLIKHSSMLKNGNRSLIYLAIILVLSVNLNFLHAQDQYFGFSFNSGIEVYSLHLDSNESIEQSPNPVLSFGIIYKIHYSKKLLSEIGLGLNFTKRKYLYEYSNSFLDQNQQIQSSQLLLNIDRNVSFFNGNVNWGYLHKNLSFKLGLQTILYTNIKENNSYFIIINQFGFNYNLYDIGVQENLTYLFTELSFEVGIYLTDKDELNFSYFRGIGKRHYRDFAPRHRIQIGLKRFF